MQRVAHPETEDLEDADSDPDVAPSVTISIQGRRQQVTAEQILTMPALLHAADIFNCIPAISAGCQVAAYVQLQSIIMSAGCGYRPTPLSSSPAYSCAQMQTVLLRKAG